MLTRHGVCTVKTWKSSVGYSNISIYQFKDIFWTLSIKTSNLVDAMEAMETNSRVTYFSSSSYTLKNNPIISFLAADVT